MSWIWCAPGKAASPENTKPPLPVFPAAGVLFLFRYRPKNARAFWMAKSQKRHSWWYPSTSSNTAERPIFSAYALKCVYDSTLLIFQKNSFLPTYSRYWQRLLFDYLLTAAKTKKRRRFSSSPLFGEPSGIFPLRGGACPPPTAVPDGAPSSRPGVPPAPPASLRPFRVRIPAFSSAKNNGDGKNRLRYLVNHRGFEPRTP